MRIIITGLPYFGKMMQSDLANFDKKNCYYFCDTYYSRADKIKFAILVPFCKLVISINGVSDNSGSLNWAIKWKKKIMMLWQGTDVLLATERFNDKTILHKYIDYSTHYSDSEQLIQELKQIEIDAKLLYFKHIKPLSNSDESFKTISVYSYIGQNREEFYGLKTLLPVFEHFKNIQFHIIGTEAKSFPTFSNVKYHGWIDNNQYQEIANQSAIFIRLTDHDGYSKSVQEALANGSEVIWNMKHPKCRYAQKESNDVIKLLSDLIQCFELNHRQRNIDNIHWVQQNLDKERVLSNLISTISKGGGK